MSPTQLMHRRAAKSGRQSPPDSAGNDSGSSDDISRYGGDLAAAPSAGERGDMPVRATPHDVLLQHHSSATAPLTAAHSSSAAARMPSSGVNAAAAASSRQSGGSAPAVAVGTTDDDTAAARRVRVRVSDTDGSLWFIDDDNLAHAAKHRRTSCDPAAVKVSLRSPSSSPSAAEPERHDGAGDDDRDDRDVGEPAEAASCGVRALQAADVSAELVMLDDMRRSIADLTEQLSACKGECAELRRRCHQLTTSLPAAAAAGVPPTAPSPPRPPGTVLAMSCCCCSFLLLLLRGVLTLAR
jgi:hypothetical protein